MSKALFAALIVLSVALVARVLVDVGNDQDQIKRFSSYEELKSFLQSSSQGGAYIGDYGSFGAMRTTAITESTAPQPQAPDFSKTNIQVEGVDEADIVKNDGKYIYLVSGNKIVIVDAYPAETSNILSETDINGTPQEIFINGDKLVVFGSRFDYPYEDLRKSSVLESTAIVPYYSSKSFIKVYDISNREKPVIARELYFDGNYYESRMVGDYVYAVINQPVYYYQDPVPLPMIYQNGEAREVSATDVYYFDYPDSSYIYTNIISVNTQDDDEDFSTKVFLLGYTQNIFVSKDNLYITYQKRVNQYEILERVLDEAVVPIVPSDVKGDINQVRNSNLTSYQKMDEIGKILQTYLESLDPEKAANLMRVAERRIMNVYVDIYKETYKTVVHKISIDNGKIEYRTKGEVPGQVLNQFSMDEHNGYFRIATTTNPFNSWGGGLSQEMSQVIVTSAREMQVIESKTVIEPSEIAGETQVAVPKRATTPAPEQQIIEPVEPVRLTSQNHVYVLDENLDIVGRLENLASGERIYSVRFIGDKAYMVTFRQIDPLFVIDLKDPNNPKVLGYLKIPGVSDYLHPYDEDHIIGVGRDATEQGMITGMKLSLFDVSDVQNPKEVSKVIIGSRGTDSEVLRDHKAFLFDRSKNLLVIPVRVAEENDWNAFQGAYVFNVDLNGFVLKGKITHRNDTGTTDNFYYDYEYEVRRSLYIGDVLYTISNKMIKMNDIGDLTEINRVVLS